MEQTLEQKLQQIFNEDTGFAGRAGIRLTELGEGWAKGEILLNETHRNAIGTVHGGCIFTLADAIAGAAALSSGMVHTTVSADVHFLSPAMKSTKLLAHAATLKRGRNMTVLQVQITDDTGAAIAAATASFFNLGTPVCP